MTSYFFIKILVPRVKIPVKFWEALDSYHLPRAGLHPLSLSSVLPRLPKDHASTIQRGVDQNSTLLTQNNVLCSGFLVSGKRKGKKSVSSCKLNVKYCGYLCMCFRWWLWGLWYSSGFQKVLEGERLRKNSSSRVSCTSLLKSFKASFLEWRDWIAAGEEPNAQGVHACKPGFPSRVPPGYPWILESLLTAGLSPSSSP